MIDIPEGAKLDIGCGNAKQKGFMGMDKRDIPGVDIIHDLEVFPYPFDDGVFPAIHGHHIMEHVKPWFMNDIMNELWRIAKPDATLFFALPFAGTMSYWQDPTHCNGCTDMTFRYYTPSHFLYDVYRPKPWKLVDGFPRRTGELLEVLLTKMEEVRK